MIQLPEILDLQRPMIGLDLETTGVDPRTSGIVEIGLEIMVPGRPVKEYRTLVNPIMPIPPEATEIHGITNEMVADAPTFIQLADNLLLGFQGCDFAGYSVAFDLRQMVEEFKRAGKTWDYEDARIIDAFRLWQIIEGRTLSHAVERWLRSADEPVDHAAVGTRGEAHSALWDIKMSTRIVAAQLLENPALPRSVAALHDVLWPNRVDADGKLTRNGDKVCINFGQHRGKQLDTVPRGYLKWMIGGDFSPRVKRILTEHLEGR